MPSCQAGETGLVRDVLYFGRNRPAGGEVADADWEAFLGAVVTPRFPDGLTIVEAHGQKKVGPTNARLAHDIWDIWLGQKPISADLKKGMLDRIDTLGR